MNGCPIGGRRLLCQQEGNATCERVDGRLVHCHETPEEGCPHTHRALSSAGHLLNTEDLELPCYEVCANSTLLLRCAEGWKDLGTCSSKGDRRRKRKLRADGPVRLFGSPLPLHTPVERDFEPAKTVVRSLMQASALFRTRRQLYEATGDWESAWAHSKATDKVPLFRQLDWVARSFLAATRIPPDLPKPPKRRELKSAVSACEDPTLTYCCSGACVGPNTPCPAINPNSFTESWCQSLQGATDAVNNFDIATYISSVVQCVNDYSAYPDTDPFGPDADSSSTIRYCFPMSGPVNWGFGDTSFNLQGLINTACGGPGLATINCQCPMYWNSEFDYIHMWFAFVALGPEAMIYNFFIVLQLMISALTGQDGPLWFIGVAWYSFWIVWPWINNTWWPYIFLLRPGFTNWGQEEMCAFLHFGSFWFVVWCLVWIKILMEVFVPLMQDLLELTPFPSHFKRYKGVEADQTKVGGTPVEMIKQA